MIRRRLSDEDAATPGTIAPPSAAEISADAGSAWDIIAALGAIGAGIYLLLSRTADPNSYLQVLAHGIGVYFIAKGIFMARSARLQARMAAFLEELVRRGV